MLYRVTAACSRVVRSTCFVEYHESSSLVDRSEGSGCTPTDCADSLVETRESQLARARFCSSPRDMKCVSAATSWRDLTTRPPTGPRERRCASLSASEPLVKMAVGTSASSMSRTNVRRLTVMPGYDAWNPAVTASTNPPRLMSKQGSRGGPSSSQTRTLPGKWGGWMTSITRCTGRIGLRARRSASSHAPRRASVRALSKEMAGTPKRTEAFPIPAT